MTAEAGQQRLRVAFVSVVPSPYQRDLFAALAAREDVMPRVFYMERAAPDSPWPERPLATYESRLPGFWFPIGSARVHVNWRLPSPRDYDVIVCNTLMSLTGQWLMRTKLRHARWMFWGEKLGPRSRRHDVLTAPLHRASGIAAIGSWAERDYAARFPGTRIFNIPYHCELGPFAAEPQFAEGAVLDDVTEHVAALVQNRVAVGHEQQPGARQVGSEMPVVEGGHHGLAGTGGSDDKRVGMAAQTLDLEAFEDGRLEGQGGDVERSGDAIVGTGDGNRTGEAFLLEGLVVRVGPIGREGPLEGVDEFGVDALGGADVPFEAGDLGGEGEVGRADVHGGEAGGSVEQPRLRMEASRGGVVGDLDLGTEIHESL